MQTNDLSQHDLERIEELKQTFGFEVVNAGFTCTIAEAERTVTLCYWRNKRGVRESAIFPNHEAAWRDALRVHEEATDAVKANPGVHRIKQNPQSQELSILKGQLKKAGYTFTDRAWSLKDLTVDGHGSHDATIRDAVRHWARVSPDAFIDAMSKMGSRVITAATDTIDAVTPLTAVELVKLQSITGFNEMPAEHKALTIKQQEILKHLKQRGMQIDTSLMSAEQLAQAACIDYSATLIDNPIATVAFKAQGKSFEEVEEDQRNAKRAYGLVEGSAEEKKLRHLEAIGYEFFFTAAWGWKCKPDVNASGALETVVRAAWAIAVKQEGADKYDLLDAMGLPYIGSTVWVQNIYDPKAGNVPYNVQGLEEERLVKVLAYDGMTAWLKLCSDMGEPVNTYIIAQIDKVKIRGWKGNCDA